LGGVGIPDVPGLSGHSDGDAVLHAVIDAILGAASLGNIGERFPDNDPTYAGINSALLLEEAMAALTGEGFSVVNVDITVIAQLPQIQPYARSMERTIADLLRVSAGDVSVKGKSNEGMGWIGREEGLAVIATVLIDRDDELDAPDVSHRIS